MSGKQMEGDSRERRKKAREARERGRRPSGERAPTGASQQRQHLPRDEEHEKKVEAIPEGKQRMLSENTPEVRPRSRGGNVYRP
jgi:hypothetical protein